jgi:hypothetical protein
MRKLLVIAVVLAVGYAWQKDRIKEFIDSQKAGFDDAQAERSSAAEEARAQRVREQEEAFRTPAAAPQPAARSTLAADCERARNNVQQAGQWMQQGGTLVEKNSRQRLSENESFDAAARNRQFIEDNCR